MPRRKVRIGGRTPALDARPDRLDLRDLPYRARLGCLPARWPRDEDASLWQQYVHGGFVLDQGDDGACTGFGLAAVVDYLAFLSGLDSRTPPAPMRRSSPAMFYELARMYDEWPGEDYEGSSCRGALKGWHRHGVCQASLWPYELSEGRRKFQVPRENSKDRDDPESNWDIDALRCTIGVYYRIDSHSIVDMQAAIRETGAIYCSATAHEGWDIPNRRDPLRKHEDLELIEHVASPKEEGGHAFALVGYNERGFVVQNSWGTDWGSSGFALLPYEDWIAHGEDAWVFTLGVPRTERAAAKGAQNGKPAALRAPRFFVPGSEEGRIDLRRPVGLIGAEDAWTQARSGRSANGQGLPPLDPDQAYRYAILLDRGFPVRNDMTAQNAVHALERAAYDEPGQWLRDHKGSKLLIYAHGGLNSEAASIRRIRMLAPYALANGIYPLFVTWRSGPLETLSDMMEETLAKFGFGARGVRAAESFRDRFTEKTDRILEPLLRGPGGAMWQQMKLNAMRASEHTAGGCRGLVHHLQRLFAQHPDLEVHLMGHSAGAIVLGGMLKRMQEAQLRAASLRLFAPACTTRFALDHFKPAVDAQVIDPRHWYIHTLSDANEHNDRVGPYRKSLLYLVSRALEDAHKMPLLGLEKAFDPATAQERANDDLWASEEAASVREWANYWSRLGNDTKNRVVLKNADVSTGAGSVRATHYCFDNAVDIMGDALGYVASSVQPKRITIERLDYD